MTFDNNIFKHLHNDVATYNPGIDDHLVLLAIERDRCPR